MQAPFYATFFWNIPCISSGPLFWLIAFPIALMLAATSIWLFRNIKIENAYKRWFKLLFSSKEWTLVTGAAKYLSQIEEFKKDLSQLK